MLIKLVIMAIVITSPVAFSLCKVAGNADKLIEKMRRDSLRNI